MSINKLVDDFLSMSTQSETEVRTKFVIPLFELLGYPTEFRAEEFPVYGYEGGKAINAKSADILFFNSVEFTNNRERKKDERNWVCEHSILVVEVKKRGESINAEGQAIYYAAWTRSPLYIVSNGEDTSFYKINSNFSDELVLSCKIAQIPENWQLISSIFSYSKAIMLKETTSCIKANFKIEYYSEYCNSLMLSLNETLNCMVARDLNKNGNSYFNSMLQMNNEQMDYHKVLENKKAKFIVSEPGGGKTYLLNMIAREYLSNIYEGTEKIPIIIKCEYFGILYDSIEKAIYNEVKSYNSDLTYEMVVEDINKGRFILLFDALDEVRNNKKALINCIKLYIMSTDNEILITERKENYLYELGTLCDLYEIVPLTDQIVAQYIQENTIKNISIHNLRLDNKFKSMLATPLFLYIVVEILNNQLDNQNGLPANKSVLFEHFYRYPLKDKLTIAELNLLEEIFAKYAEFLIYNQESDSKLIDIIQSIVGSNQCEKYYELMLKTGIMSKGTGGYKFFHYTFLEYFHAKELSKKSQQDIEMFLSKYTKDENYIEIICLLVGIIAESNKQNFVLDYLQKNNLPLFVKALQSRYKFDSNSIDIEYDYSYEYFLQIRNTYVELINRYFFKIRQYFFPYYMTDFDDKINKVKIIGKIDYEHLGINVKFEVTKKDDDDVEFTKLEGHPKIFVGNDTTAQSVFSMSTPDGTFYFNLKSLYMGIDSAREIALKIFKNRLFELIDKKIAFDMDNSVLMAEDIEMALDYLNRNNKLPVEVRGLSLYRNLNEVCSFFIGNRDKPEIRAISFHGSKIAFVVYAAYSVSLLASGVNINDLLPIKNDLKFTDLHKKGNGYYKCDLYTDANLQEAVKKVIILTEYAYKEMVNINFKELSEYMSSYNQSIYKMLWIERNEDYGASIEDININVSKDKCGLEIHINEKAPDFPYEKDEKVNQKLNELGCTGKDIISSSKCIVDLYMEDRVLHKRVYSLLKSDFEKLLGEK